MAGNARYELHLVKADATVIDQVTSGSVAPNADVRRMKPLGAIDPSVLMFMGSAPVFRFSTTKVGTVLGAIGIDGLDCATALELGFIERTAGGAYEAGGEKVAAAKCLVVPESLRVSQDGYAELAYLCNAYSSDGATDPLDHTASLPTGTPAVSELFTLGEVTINTAAIGDVQDVSIDFGINVQTWKSDGDLYPTKVSLVGPREPVITVTASDMGELSDGDLRGTEVTDVVVNLIKLSTTGGGLAGAGDKTISAKKAYAVISNSEADHPGDGNVTFMFYPRKEGANAILAIA